MGIFNGRYLDGVGYDSMPGSAGGVFERYCLSLGGAAFTGQVEPMGPGRYQQPCGLVRSGRL